MAAKKKAAKAAKKVPAKKVVAKKAAPKKAPAKAKAKAVAVKVVAKPQAVKLSSVKEPMAKTAVLQHIANNVGITRKQVAQVMEELSGVVAAHVNKKAPGQFVLPGLLKITVVRKPAQKGGKKVMMMGREVVTKSKPARNVVRIRALKKLKDMAS
ncbi:MAG: HU family DNA-binding protein [Gammaproteobacteria bacterium]